MSDTCIKIYKVFSLNLLFLLLTTKSWLQEFFTFNYFSAFLAMSLAFPLMIIAGLDYLKNFKKNNIAFFEVLFTSLILITIFMGGENRFDLLKFSIIFVISILLKEFSRKKNNDSIIALAIVFFGLLVSMSVFLGVIEAFFLSTDYFYEINNPLNPNPAAQLLGNYSGFFYSYNMTAYALIFCIGFVSFTEISKKIKLYIYIAFFIALALTQSKIIYIYFLALAFLCFFDKKPILLITLALLSMFYLIFTHVIIEYGSDGNSLILNKYKTMKALSFLDFNLYLSLFTQLKVDAFRLINSNPYLSYPELINGLNGSEPHSLPISLIVLLGYPSIFLLIAILFKNSRIILQSREDQSLLKALFFCFIVELVIWDAQDSIIFWLGILLPPIFLTRKHIYN